MAQCGLTMVGPQVSWLKMKSKRSKKESLTASIWRRDCKIRPSVVIYSNESDKVRFYLDTLEVDDSSTLNGFTVRGLRAAVAFVRRYQKNLLRIAEKYARMSDDDIARSKYPGFGYVAFFSASDVLRGNAAANQLRTAPKGCASDTAKNI